jgi:quinol monooxygenase YgiN
MTTHGHIARFAVQPGRREEAIEVLRPMFAQAETEPGTLLYLMHVSAEEDDVIWFYERYRDEAAFAAHTSSATHQDVLEKLKPLLADGTEVTYLDLIAEKGLPRAGQS